MRAEFYLYQTPNSYAPSSTTRKTELPLLPLTIWGSVIVYKLRRENGALLKKRGSEEFEESLVGIEELMINTKINQWG